MHAGADDDLARLDVAAGRFDDGRAAATDEPDDLAAEQQLASRGAHVLRVCVGDPREVDDRRLRRVERPDARGVRLELAQPLRPDQLDARHAVRERAAVELVEPRQLVLARRDDDLAAAEHRDAALVAVREQPLRAVDAEPRLERAGRVVDAAVDDAARAPGLVARRRSAPCRAPRAAARPPRLELPRDREPEDPRADDGDVVAVAGRCLAQAGHRVDARALT